MALVIVPIHVGRLDRLVLATAVEIRMANEPPVLPSHIEDTVQAIATVHTEHYKRAAPLQRIIACMTAIAGRPGFSIILTVIVFGWVSANLIILGTGHEPWDPPPFPWLSGLASLVALYTTILILATQRHDNELARHREQLTLEIAILSEQKTAKIIQILEQMRQDSPHLENRADHEAQVMSNSVDPQFVLSALKDAHKSNR